MSEDDKNFNFIEITGSDRMNFCQKHFGDCIFDTKMFDIADQMIVGYNGGYWDYFEWKGLPIFSLSSDTKLVIRNPHSGGEYVMDKILAGIIVSIYTYSYYIELGNDKMAEYIHRLTDLAYSYAEELGEFDAAYKMLD
jgi:hypothetical protein